MSFTPRLVQRVGLALAAAGLVAAAVVHARVGATPEADAVARQRELRELERLGGTATLRAVEFDGWLGSLWHGERLAVTLAVLGLALGGLCWHLGGLMAEETDDAT